MSTIQSGCGDTTLGHHQDASQDFSQSLARYTDKHTTKSRQTSIDQPSRNSIHPVRHLFAKKLTIRKVNPAPADKGTLLPTSLNTASFDLDAADPRASQKSNQLYLSNPDALAEFLQSTVSTKKNYLNKIVVVNPSARQIGRLRKNF